MSKLETYQKDIVSILSKARQEHKVSEEYQLCYSLVSRLISDMEIENEISLKDISSSQFHYIIGFLLEQLGNSPIYDEALFSPVMIRSLIKMITTGENSLE